MQISKIQTAIQERLFQERLSKPNQEGFYFIEAPQQSIRNLTKLCKLFGLDQDLLDNFLIENGGIIAGGSLLWCIKPFSNFDSDRLQAESKFDGDIDIFFPNGSSQEISPNDFSNDWIESGKGTVYQTQIDFEYHKSRERIYKKIPNVKEIKTWTKLDKKIQFIYLETDYPKAHVRTFDMSVCQNIYDGKAIYMNKLYKELTLAGFNELLKDVKTKDDQVFSDRIKKYESRGYKSFSNNPKHLSYAQV